MLIGVNWTGPEQLPLIRALLADGSAQFCEILIDNFLAVPAEELASALDGRPVAFHIMNSRFLERDPGELRTLGGAVRALATDLKPLYVSDHLGLFSHAGRRLPFLMELDYVRDYATALEATLRWQELLGAPLYLENFPSILDGGRAQPQFLERLAAEAGARVLFDFSNAVAAERNCGVDLRAWEAVIAGTTRFHAAGYRASDTDPVIIQDSHDGELSEETLRFLGRSRPWTRPGATLSIERDANIERDSWTKDLRAVRALIP